jgi:hypothetical protein
MANSPQKDTKSANKSDSNNDYVIISKHELDNLKREIQELKKGSKGYTSVTIEELNDSILNLNHSVHMLLELFEGAAKEFKRQEESDLEGSGTNKLASKLDVLIEQNKAMAKGILYLVRSDKEEKEQLKQEREEQRRLRETLMKREHVSAPSNTGNRRFNAPKNVAPSLINELNEFNDENQGSNNESSDKREPPSLTMPPHK